MARSSIGQKPSQRAPLVAKSPRTKAAKQVIAQITLERLSAEYPDAHCELDHRNAFELLCATILSAQCTDVRVNMVTPSLFARYPDAVSLADAKPEDVEEIVRSTGFFRAKARNLVSMAQSLVRDCNGDVPRTIAEHRRRRGAVAGAAAAARCPQRRRVGVVRRAADVARARARRRPRSGL